MGTALVWLLVGSALPETIPVPEPRPDIAVEPTPDTEPKSLPEAAPIPDAPPPVEIEDTEALGLCLQALGLTGSTFRPLKVIDDADGCGIDKPIEVLTLGQDIALEPVGIMRCETALQLSRWVRGMVIPMLREARPGETLDTINQASAYVCRKRNGAESGKISEHARGNAVDIAGFTFKSGKTFEIAPRDQDGTLDGAFQRAIASAACLYFTTVLDPSSDKAHETHLHLDVLKRKAGYRYCW